MKKLVRELGAWVLRLLATGIIRKYRPQVVMITGSVGKTSTKDAVACALTDHFYLRASEKSYNTEFGVPLTIFGAKNPWTNLFRWISVLEEALITLLFPNHYPKLLVLEVGADRPGDLARILRIATPDAVVVTRLPEVPVHVEAYATPQAVRDEEFAPAYALTAGAPLVIPSDDAYAKDMASRLFASVTTFGFSEESDVRIVDETIWEEEGRILGMKATLISENVRYELSVRRALGRPQLLAPAAAFALSRSLKLPVAVTLNSLTSYTPPPGRGRLLAGKHDSLLIDDSYNASPDAVLQSLATLALLKGKRRRIAVLGDMLELGRYSAHEHAHIGEEVRMSADLLVTVGIRARAIGEAAKACGMEETTVSSFTCAEDAGEYLSNLIEKGDAVLVKGSQSVRMERIMKVLLKNPEDAAMLVRQEPEWLVVK
jgi:UDP-N-acetylmuramoyl-tripeptide--D-alanyl-D-alanine ligase